MIKLILTGFMATGKSAIGPIAARRLGWRFIDSDAIVIAAAGKPIAAIFAQDGEPHFRALERAALASIASDRHRCPQCHTPMPSVVSTGGGAIVDEANLAEMRRAGVIVCLTARPDVIALRVGRSVARRPKLMEGGKPLEARIRELMAERAPAYARADATVDTSDLPIEKAVDSVLDAFVARARLRCAPSA